jgi:hypothetical protein
MDAMIGQICKIIDMQRKVEQNGSMGGIKPPLQAVRDGSTKLSKLQTLVIRHENGISNIMCSIISMDIVPFVVELGRDPPAQPINSSITL